MADAAARNASTHRRQAGWIGTVAALLGLVVAGFLGGALIGFLWEEPRLVIAYLSGETDEVEWSQPDRRLAEEPDASDVAAAPPAEPEPAERESESADAEPLAEIAPPEHEVAAAPTPKPEPRPAPAAAPAKPAPAPAAAVGAGRFAVQVGAFSESASAERLVQRLQKSGYRAYLAPASSGNARWRVRVGPVPTRPEAEALAAKLTQGESLSTWVLDENAG